MTSAKVYTKNEVDMALMAKQVDSIEKAVKDITQKLDAEYITKAEVEARLKIITMQLELLQRIVYGMVGLILTTVIGGMVVFFINAPKQ